MRDVARVASLVSLVAIAAIGSAVLSPAAEGRSESRTSLEAVVDPRGNLHVPSGYRASYEFLGVWAIAAGEGVGSKEIHIVFATPGAIASYRSNGHFPDGTVLIKEVHEASTAPMTTGTVSHAQTLKGWFVMVKDSKNSYPSNPLWGDGWGWSWFDAGNPTKTTSTNYQSNCLPCHVPAQATDWVYTFGYPPLE